MKTRKQKSEKGFAILESVVFMMAFVILAAYTIDLFTVVHTGILNSMAARTYLFETLQHRSNINALRQDKENNGDPTLNFASMHYRFHSVQDEGQGHEDTAGAKAAGRIITQADATGHNMNDPTLDSQKNETNIVYIKTGYGICLDSACPQ